MTALRPDAEENMMTC